MVTRYLALTDVNRQNNSANTSDIESGVYSG